MTITLKNTLPFTVNYMADGSLSVGGLASGLDTQGIITSLIAIENTRVAREQTKKSDYELKLSTFNELKTKLTDFNTKAVDMNKPTALNVFKSSSSDETVVKISGGENATPGNFDIEVNTLASSLKVASKSFTKTAATNSLSFTGSFTISTSAAALKSDPTVTAVTVALDGTETLKDIAAKINRAKGAGATASVIQMGTDDYRLMLTSVDEGSKAFSLTPTTGLEAKSIFSDGLDLVNQATATAGVRSARTSFDLRLATGGAATATSTFANLFNGLGSGIGVTAGDTISITGTNAAGAAIGATTFTIGATTDTLQKLLTTGDAGGNSITSAFGGAANMDVSINASGEIVIKDKTGGTTDVTLNLAFNDTNVSGSTLSLGASETKTDFKSVISDGKKAFFLLNDISMSSQTNHNTTTIDGTVFDFKKVDTAKVKVTLDYDKDGVKKKVQDFLDTYNQLLKFIDEKSKIEVKNQNTPANQQKTGLQSGRTQNVIKGAFAGDSNILGLKSQLQALMTNKIPEIDSSSLGRFSSLASMGITSESKTGFLQIDDTRFSTAIDQDFEGIKRLFATGGYSTNPSHIFGTYTSDTRTGTYYIDPALAKIDSDKSASTSTMVAATINGGGDVMNSDSGDSKGLALKATPTSGTGTMTFVRGVAGQIQDYYSKINNFVDGFLSTTAKNYQDRMNDEDKQISRLEARVASVKTRLTTQFANLEQSIAKLQQQSAAFGGQVTSLKR